MYIKPSALPADYSDKIMILRCINKPLEDITVSEICSAAGITRKKFYKLFSTKIDILLWYLDFCFSQSLYQIGRTLTWREGILACLNLVEDEKPFILLDYINLVSKARSYYWPLDSNRKAAMSETLTQRGVTITTSLELEMGFYSQLVPDLIRSWLQSEGGITIEQYAEVWESCVPRHLYEALELRK